MSDSSHGFGCPSTEMRSRKAKFEKINQNWDISFVMKKDAPHYASSKTRIAYFQFEKLPDSKWQKFVNFIKQYL